MIGVFVALDFFLFYMFWEVMLLPMYFLIGVWGGPRKEYAAIKFFLYTLAGSVLMLVALSRSTSTLAAGRPARFDLIKMATDPADPRTPSPDPATTFIGRHWQFRHVMFVVPVHRLRDQGAGLPVPHLAARRARRGADADLDDPGRRPAEDGRLRHVRIAYPDLPEAGSTRWPTGSRCSG